VVPGGNLSRDKKVAWQLYEHGSMLFRKKQFSEAESIFRQCIMVDSNSAVCHLSLGSLNARLGRIDEGARYYREFLRLAPSHEMASMVRKLLADYDKQNRR
jgi:tetratricopeptide (TPR) repeat protein